MLSLEQQIENLADAAFDATKPVDLPSDSSQPNSRLRLLTIAAAIVVGMVATAAFLTSRNDNDVLVVADSPTRVIEINDPMDLDFTAVANDSPQGRIERLGAVMALDTAALPATFEVERMFLTTTAAVFGPYEYWQQVSVRTVDGVGLVVNVYGTEAAWPPLEESAGDEVVIRGLPGRETPGVVAWLENEQLRIEILGGPGTAVSNIDQDVLELAEALSFIETNDGWTDDGEDRLGPTADGEPILAGIVAGIEWDVVEQGDELMVRAGDRNRVAFTHQANQNDRSSYTVTSLSIPGGAVIVGYAPAAVDQIEVVLDGGDVIVIPTVDAGERTAFALPVDDRLDPTELRLISNGVAVGPPIVLTYLPPYLGGLTSVGS